MCCPAYTCVGTCVDTSQNPENFIFARNFARPSHHELRLLHDSHTPHLANEMTADGYHVVHVYGTTTVHCVCRNTEETALKTNID
jgi:hypothetical protein